MTTIFFILVLVLAVLAAVAVTGGVVYLLVKRYFDNQQKERLLQIKMDERQETLRVVTPIRLQAYERLALFLERISPNSLVLRCYQPGMDLKLLQGVMTKNVRDEFEHNLSQQVYVSTEAWSRIKEAKEEMINLINSAAVSLPPDADPMSLAGAVFENSAKQNPLDTALEFLKEEIRKDF